MMNDLLDIGTVVSFSPETRTGTLECFLTGKRYWFSAVTFSFPVKVGMEFSFDGVFDGQRRVARDLRRVDARAGR